MKTLIISALASALLVSGIAYSNDDAKIALLETHNAETVISY